MEAVVQAHWFFCVESHAGLPVNRTALIRWDVRNLAKSHPVITGAVFVAGGPAAAVVGGLGYATIGATTGGGTTSRAALYKIKPFDNSYKKARKSYETKDDKGNK